MWNNKIVGHGEVDPKTLEANVYNWRTHPRQQRNALEGALNEVGWVQPVMVNKRTGRLVDGHLRVVVALERGEASIPVTYVDLDENEERVILASLDLITTLAGTDDAALQTLLDEIEVDDDSLNAFFESLTGRAESLDVIDDEPAIPEPSTERERPRTAVAVEDDDDDPVEAVRQLVFNNVTGDQKDVIFAAISKAQGMKPGVSPTEALAGICFYYVSSTA